MAATAEDLDLSSRASRLGDQPLKRRLTVVAGDDAQVARQNWDRYEYVKQRGHIDYCIEAARQEEYYLGGGRQWRRPDREAMEEAFRYPIEINEVADAVNTALGYQVNNRADIAFKPRGQGASEQVATTLSQVAMQIADNNKFQWHESQIFADGLIERRGYLEIRISFDDTVRGEIRLGTLDPRDVIPDPDAKSYDPDDWADVIITRWLTLDEIEGMYGSDARKRVEARGQARINEGDFGTDTDDVPRNSFGDSETQDSVYDAYYSQGGVVRVRLVDRQYWRMVMTRVVVYPSGDIRIAENATPEKLAAWRAAGCIIMRRPTRRVRWTVSTCDALLFDDWSPMNHFSVIPYFPFFRRGKTKGLIDDAIGPQDLLNSVMTAYNHAVKSTANSGWLVEQGSLAGSVDVDDLETEGARNGLVLEYVKGSKEPQKIKPNPIPAGLADLAAIASTKIKSTSGQNSAMKGEAGKDQSGIAVQSLQYAAQMALAVPLDNLSRTRHMTAQRMLELIQAFYDEPRIFRITKTDPLTGQAASEELQINWTQVDGSKLNDLTIGEYDVVITDQPAQVTFDNSQFNQALAMKEKGVAIPDSVLIRYSTLADKPAIIQAMQSQSPQSNPLDEAKAALAQAQALKVQAETVAKNIEALFSAIRTGQIVATMPGVAPLGDAIAKSAGFVDKDMAPIFPAGPAAETAASTVAPPPTNTNPVTPDNPQRGMEAGIESGNAAPTGAQ
jgi:hypothetical protein